MNNNIIEKLDSMTIDELLDLNSQVVGVIKAKRKYKDAIAKSSWSIGDTIEAEFKGGVTYKGTILSINRTRAKVRLFGNQFNDGDTRTSNIRFSNLKAAQQEYNPLTGEFE